MKSGLKNLFVLPALIASLGLLLPGRVPAQTFTALYTFTNGLDGGNPEYGSLILSGNKLYGTAYNGGSSVYYGTVFAVNTDGTGFTNPYSFSTPNYNSSGQLTNSDGGNPEDGLILSGNTLYGTTYLGGTNGEGIIFGLNPNGTLTTLHSFAAFPKDGTQPIAGLVLSGNTFYGTAVYGGTNGDGTVFALNTNGTGYINLYDFTAQYYNGTITSDTNTDGAYPVARLILSGNTLYGTTEYGGTAGVGTVFAVNTDGTGFTNLHNFTYGIDGAYPYAELALSGDTLYGTANEGGSFNKGTVFALNTNGAGFTTLHSFTNGIDGAYPKAGLILSGNTLYGTASGGGRYGSGTVFGINTNGMIFTNLYSFKTDGYDPYIFQSTNSDGANPEAGLILSSNTLYGTAYDGGGSGYGTVFSLSLGPVSVSAPQLTMTLSGTNVIVSWLATGFNLQSTTNLAPPAVWVPVSGQNAVTNAISGTQMFYRLSQ